ncbi:MAG: tetratricopeptide repeat protein [Sulfuricellaceae bacterium]
MIAPAPQTLPLDVALQQAVAHHQAGRLREAEQLYRAILQASPYQPDANHNLGVLAMQVGQPAAGLPFLKTALETHPAQEQYSLSYAEALLATGQAETALDALQAAGFNTPAVQALRQKAETAILNAAPAEISRLAALFNAGRYAEIDERARLLIGRYPDYGLAWKALGASLQMQGKNALTVLQRAAELLPDDAEAHYNLGNTLSDLGQNEAAAASYRRALALRPDFAEALFNLGNALRDLRQFDDALAIYRRALEIRPDDAAAYNNLGNTLNDLVQFDQAMASFRRALEIKPDYLEAHSNLLFSCNLLANRPPAEILAEARRYGESVARKARPYKIWHNPPEPDRCLRIGLVSGDLRNHPVGYFMESILAALASHASGRLEFIAYPNHFRADELTERIKPLCHGWHSAVALSDESLAQQIRDDGIDILIDLSGHTAYNRLPLFAWKPAPIQASWLGYFATTGVTAIDYLIADPWTLPKTEEAYFTESIRRLPETRLCFTPPDIDVAVSALPALANGHITFGCFNNLAKMNDDVVALWARVLATVPDSRLFLKAKQLQGATVRQSVNERFAVHGIDAARLTLEGYSPRAEYLAAYRRVDIVLDPFPYPGGTTSAESLWMGAPVLTLAGERFLSRQGVGLLMNAGLPEWIAADADEYVARAASHAADLQRLAALRDGLRQQVLASPLFDAPCFARHFEVALRDMWRKWCASRIA